MASDTLSSEIFHAHVGVPFADKRSNKQIEPMTIFRVIAPNEAKDTEVAELRSMGVRLPNDEAAN